jgi:hypothetical protein
MPLSENEQRILAEIERHLEESDPSLARNVGKRSIYRHALGSLRWSVLEFIVGLIVMVATLRVHYVLAFVGFVIMLVGAMGFERNLRLVGRAGIQQVSNAFRAANPPSGRRSDSSSED